jgi:uncharacterized membrane protein YqhA
MQLTQVNQVIDEARIFWLVVLHVTFVGSGLLFALMDWVASLEKKGHGEQTGG